MKNNILSKLIGNDTEFNLRHRILNALALIGIFMSFSASAINYFLGLGTLTVITTLGCGILTIVLYLFSIIGRHYELPALLSVIMLSFIFLPIMWVCNGGINGSIPYYMVVNAGIIAFLLSGLKRIIIFVLYTIVTGVLIYIDYWMPTLIVEYTSRLIRYQDCSFGFFTCLFSNAIIIAVLIDVYVKEKQKESQYLCKLKKQNEMIEAKNRMLEKRNAELKEAKEKAEILNKQLNKEKQKLQSLSVIDNSTGAFNKTFINNRLNQEIELSLSKLKKLTVALIDIDGFKNINDTYGHLFGDYSLKRIVKTVRKNLRQKDMIGRYGGDEFLIVLPDTSLEEGYTVIERIRKKVSELKWEYNLRVTISGGVTELNKEQLTSLLTKADRLLYKAKLNGKNRIEMDSSGKLNIPLENK